MPHKLISQTFRAVEVFIVAGAIYLILNFARHARHHGLEWWLSPHLRQPPAVDAARWKRPMSDGAPAPTQIRPAVADPRTFARASARSRC